MEENQCDFGGVVSLQPLVGGKQPLDQGPSLGELGLVDDHGDLGKGQVVGEPHLQLLSSFLAENEAVESMIAEVAAAENAGRDTGQLQESVEELLGNPERCCNCNGSLDENSGAYKTLHEDISCEFFHVALKKSVVGCIKVMDAFKALCHVGDTVTVEGEDELHGNLLLMCRKCIDKLTRLYELFNEFLSMSARYSSTLSKFTKVIVEQLQSEINVTLDKSVDNQVLTRQLADMVQDQNGQPVFNCEDEKGNNKEAVLAKSSVLKTFPGKSKAKFKNDHLCSSSQLLREDIEIIPASSENGLIQTKVLRKNSKLSSKNSHLEPFMTLDSNDFTSDTCNRCGKRFKTFGGLKIHYASHVRDDNKIACKDCGKKFGKPEALEMHQKIDHKGFKPHKCPHDGCERSFRLKDKLKLHIRVMHEKNKPFPCPKCEKAFRTKYHLKAHDVAQHVQGDNTIGCTQCRRKFPSTDALQAHVKIHEEEKRFLCSQCHKGFKTSSRLKLHEKSHDAVPSAVCATCGKAYKHARDLRLHEVVHEEESSYRFACGDCPRKFYRIDLLRVHQANEKHFSQEVVGPCVTKQESVGKAIKDKDDNKNGTEFNLDQTNADKASYYEKPSSKRKRKQEQKVKTDTTPLVKSKEPLYDCLGSPSMFPTMVPVDGIDDSSHGLEIVELTPSLTTNVISNSLFRRSANEMDSPDHSSFILNTKDPLITNLVSANNSGVTIPVASGSHYSLPVPTAGNGNTIYTIKDSSDRNISSFSISAGAEQIGYDVINAFINNLN